MYAHVLMERQLQMELLVLLIIQFNVRVVLEIILNLLEMNVFSMKKKNKQQ